jgi:hypothetical protein
MKPAAGLMAGATLKPIVTKAQKMAAASEAKWLRDELVI